MAKVTIFARKKRFSKYIIASDAIIVCVTIIAIVAKIVIVLMSASITINASIAIIFIAVPGVLAHCREY